MWDYFCPACGVKTAEKDERCPRCGTVFEVPPEKRRVPPEVLQNRKALADYVHKRIFPTLTKAQRGWMSQWFTVIFTEGFESNDWLNWTTTSRTTGELTNIVTTEPHHGTYEADFICDGSSTNEEARANKTITAAAELYVRAYVKILTNLPSANTQYELIHFRGTAQLSCVYARNTAGTMYWRILWKAGATTNTTSYTPGPALDTWYCVVLYTKVAASPNGEYRLWVDGNALIAETGKDSDDYGNITSVRVGEVLSTGQTAHTNRMDCIVFADQMIGEEIDLSVSEGVAHADSSLRMFRRAKTVSDGYTLKSVGSLELEKTLNLPADGLSHGEAMTRRFWRSLLPVDYLTLSDQAVRSRSFSKLFTDELTLADVASALKLLTRMPSDAFSYRDDTTKLLQTFFNLTAYDPFRLGDSPLPLLFKPIYLADSLTLADAIARSFARGIPLSDSLTLADTLTQLRRFNKLQADNLNLSDQTALNKLYPRSLTDGLNLADALTQLRAFNKMLAESYRINDGSPPPADANLRLWLPFEEGAGATTADESQNGYNGSITGATWGAGKYGNALDFDGVTNSYVDLGDVLRFETGDFSVAFWVKYTSGSWAFITKGWAFHGPNGWGIAYEGGVSVALQGRVGVPANCPLTVGEWTYVTVTFDRDALGKTYKNGVEVDSFDISTKDPIVGTADSLLVGKYLATSDANCRMDEARIWNTALTPDQVWQEYERSRDRPRYSLTRNRQLTNEALNLADQTNRSRGIKATPTDALSLYDALYKQRSITEALRDYLTLADSAKVSKDRRLSLADSLTLSDATYKLIQLRKVLSDALTLADAVSSSMVTPEFNITLVDALTLAETLTTQLKKILLLLDGVTLSDSTRLSRAVNRTVTEGHTLHDELLRQMKRAVSLSDTATLADTLRIAINRYRSFVDGLTLADSLARRTLIQRTASEYYALADFTYTLVTRRELLSDAYSLSDLLRLSAARATFLTDALTIKDDASLRRMRNATLADVLTLSDAHAELLSKMVRITESTTLADALILRTLRQVTLTDGLTLADALSLTKGAVKTVSLVDGISLFDGIARSVARNIGLVDGFYLWSEASRQSQLRRSLVEAMTLSDTPYRSIFRNVRLTDALSHSDLLVRYIARNILLSDSLVLGDSLKQQRTFNKIILDAFSLYDLCPRPPMTVKIYLTDALSLVEWSHTPLVAVVRGPIQTLTWKSIAQYLEYLRSGKLPDESVARNG